MYRFDHSLHCTCLEETLQYIIWVFPKIGVPQNGWFVMENPIKIHDLGVLCFLKHPYIRLNLICFFSVELKLTGEDFAT